MSDVIRSFSHRFWLRDKIGKLQPADVMPTLTKWRVGSPRGEIEAGLALGKRPRDNRIATGGILNHAVADLGQLWGVGHAIAEQVWGVDDPKTVAIRPAQSFVREGVDTTAALLWLREL